MLDFGLAHAASEALRQLSQSDGLSYKGSHLKSAHSCPMPLGVWSTHTTTRISNLRNGGEVLPFDPSWNSLDAAGDGGFVDS